MLCLTANQPAGFQAAEAQALNHASDPAAQDVSLFSSSENSAPLSKTSTWTGLVDLDKEGVNSIAGIGNSSEISEEHVIIHLRPEESRKQEKDGSKSGRLVPEIDVLKSSNILGHSDTKSFGSYGGSSQEEEDGGYFRSDSASLFPGESSTPQPESTNSVLAKFVNTLMNPFRHWTGGKEQEEEERLHNSLSVPEKKVVENQTRNEASSRNQSEPGTGRDKGKVENAIVEQTSDRLSFRTATVGLQNPEEGLYEQEKEVNLPIPLLPAVEHTGKSATSSQTEEQASSSSAAASLSQFNGEMLAFVSLLQFSDFL